MATLNPFDLLGDDAEDPSQLAVPPEKIERTKKAAPGETQAQPAKSGAKLPSKPLLPAQTVREAKNEASRGGGRGGGRGRARGGAGGYNRDFSNSDVAGGNNGLSGGYGRPSEEGDAVRSTERRVGYGGPRGSFRGGRRGGFSNGEAGEGEQLRRPYERRSGTGRGNEFKRDGAGRGNWGTPGEEFAAETEEPGVETEKDVVEKQAGDDEAADANKETPVEAAEEKEPEDKEMTLDEYEKILEEKRKALQATNLSERKVDVKEFESMQQLSNKKTNDEVFIKLGSDKDKRKDGFDKEEKAKKSVSINEFLKPADGEYYPRGGRGRGRGRGRGGGGGFRGGYSGYQSESAPAIEDTAQFPSLGGK